MNSSDDYYLVLNVPPEASRLQIKRAYRNMVLQSHPDRVPPEQREAAEVTFKELTKAYFVLGQIERRKMYDQRQMVQENTFKTTEIWGFVDPTGNVYDKDTFESYYRDQRKNSEVLRLDGRDILGGSIAKTWLVFFIVVFFWFGKGAFTMFPIIYLGIDTLLPIPVIIAALYIMAEPVRDFFWEYVAEDTIYDISALMASWLFILVFAFLIVSKFFVFIPMMSSGKPEKEEKHTDTIISVPVNLDRFKGSVFDPTKERAPSMADQI